MKPCFLVFVLFSVSVVGAWLFNPQDLWTNSNEMTLTCQLRDKINSFMRQLAAGFSNLQQTTDAINKAVIVEQKAKEAKEWATEKLSHLSQSVTDSLDLVDSFVRNATDNLKNVAFDFANCSTEKNTCKLCQNINISMFGIQDELCISLTYLADEKGISTSIDLGNSNLYHKALSITNPPPICYVPMGFNSICEACIILSNLQVDTETRKLTGCVSSKLSLFYKLIDKVYTKEFGCFALSASPHEKKFEALK